MSLLVRSQALVPEVASALGRTLRLSFQLRDATGRTAVDLTGVTLRPVLSYAAPLAAGGGGLNVTRAELSSCGAGGIDAVSGVGECAVPLDAALFPSAGSLTANVTLQLRIK